MQIVEDTRNQKGKHSKLNQQLLDKGVCVIRSKLYVGDYTRLDNMSVCIDTKKDWVELAGNICGAQHTRFRNECIRAQNAGIRLIILVEEETPILEWISPKKRNGENISNVDPKTLAKAMATMTEKYGVEFRNCDKSKTAEMIIKILGGKTND